MKNINVERIKSACRIEDVAHRYLTLKGNSKRLIGLCPFHEDHSPSFTVYPETQTFYCFGCGAHGDVLDFIMKLENLSFPGACGYLAKKYGINLPREKRGRKSKKGSYRDFLGEIGWLPSDRFNCIRENKKKVLSDILPSLFRLSYKSTEIVDEETGRKAIVQIAESESRWLWLEEEIKDWEEYFEKEKEKIRNEERSLFNE